MATKNIESIDDSNAAAAAAATVSSSSLDDRDDDDHRDDYAIQKSPKPDYENQDFHVDYDIDFTRKFLKVVHSYQVSPVVEDPSYVSEFALLKKFLQPRIEEYLEDHLSIKSYLTILAEFFKNNSLCCHI